MPEQINELLDQYWDKFGDAFPLYQEPDDWETLKDDLIQCIEKGIPAQKLKPDLYGACIGKDF